MSADEEKQLLTISGASGLEKCGKRNIFLIYDDEEMALKFFKGGYFKFRGFRSKPSYKVSDANNINQKTIVKRTNIKEDNKMEEVDDSDEEVEEAGVEEEETEEEDETDDEN